MNFKQFICSINLSSITNFLSEASIESIEKNNEEKLSSLLGHSKHKSWTDYIASNFDPTYPKQNKYTLWMINGLLRKQFDLNDLDNAKVILDHFDKNSKFYPKQLTQYKTIKDIESDSKVAMKKQVDDNMKALVDGTNNELLYSDGKNWVIVSNTFKGNKLFRDSARWCTSTDEQYFDTYSKGGAKLYIINLNDDLYQIQYPSNGKLNLKNIYDADVSFNIRCLMLDHIPLLSAISNTPDEETYTLWKDLFGVKDKHLEEYTRIKDILNDLSKIKSNINDAIINDKFNNSDNSIVIDMNDDSFTIPISNVLKNIKILSTEALNKLLRYIFLTRLDRVKYLYNIYNVYSYKEWAKYYMYYMKEIDTYLPIVFNARFSIPYSYLIVSGKLDVNDMHIDILKRYLFPSSDALKADMFFKEASDKVKSLSSLKDILYDRYINTPITEIPSVLKEIARYIEVYDLKITDNIELINIIDNLIINYNNKSDIKTRFFSGLYSFENTSLDTSSIDNLKYYLKHRPKFIPAAKIYHKCNNLFDILFKVSNNDIINVMIDSNVWDFRSELEEYIDNISIVARKKIIREFPVLTDYIDVDKPSKDALSEIVTHMNEINALGTAYVKFNKGHGYEERYKFDIPTIDFNDSENILIIVSISGEDEITIQTSDKSNSLYIVKLGDLYRIVSSEYNKYGNELDTYKVTMDIYHKFILRYLINEIK